MLEEEPYSYLDAQKQLLQQLEQKHSSVPRDNLIILMLCIGYAARITVGNCYSMKKMVEPDIPKRNVIAHKLMHEAISDWPTATVEQFLSEILQKQSISDFSEELAPFWTARLLEEQK